MLNSSLIAKFKAKSTCRSQLIRNLCEEINHAHGAGGQAENVSSADEDMTTGNSNDQVDVRYDHEAEESPEEFTMDHDYNSSFEVTCEGVGTSVSNILSVAIGEVDTERSFSQNTNIVKGRSMVQSTMSQLISPSTPLEILVDGTNLVFFNGAGSSCKQGESQERQEESYILDSLVHNPEKDVTFTELDEIQNLGSIIPVQDDLATAFPADETEHVQLLEGEYIVDQDNNLQPIHDTPEEPMLNKVKDNEDELGPVGANEVEQAASDFTKKGEPRKRRKLLLSPTERADIKKSRIKNLHPVKEDCNCKMKCGTIISDNQRIKINEQYWNLSRQEQKSFIFGAINRKPVQRQTAGCASRRKDTVEYYLKDEQGYPKKVCKVFFLSTLGYSKNNDSIIQTMCKQTGVSPKVDGRQGKSPHNKIDRTLIQKHIKSFNPSISHYRREHAPHRLYLPSDLTITKMYNDFRKTNPDFTCSYDLYREEIDKMNISFVKLGHEECEYCEHFKQHPHALEEPDDNCQDCQDWKTHINRASIARDLYHKDKIKEPQKDEIVYSIDLQKVIMLPRLDMFKKVIFSQRLSVYNETFAPVGSSKSKPNIVPVLWHEAIAGRKKEDIVSAMFKFLSSSEARDAKKIVFWMDNCTSQNKNWTIFTFFVYIVNSSLISADDIVVKYFEPGHTFMAADSFHHLVEKSMKTNKQSKVYDFNDFQEATSMASKKVTVLSMQLEDFCKWKSFMPKKKVKNSPERPYIHDIVTIQAKRGSLVLSYKKEYNDDWKTLNFLQMKIMKTGKIPEPEKRKQPRGISVQRKGSLLELLKGKSSVIPANRLEFWHSLPLTENEGRGDASDSDDA